MLHVYATIGCSACGYGEEFDLAEALPTDLEVCETHKALPALIDVMPGLPYGVETFTELAEFAEVLGEVRDQEAYWEYVDNLNGDVRTVQEFEEDFLGVHESFEAFAKSYLADSGFIGTVKEIEDLRWDIFEVASESQEGVFIFRNS